VRVGCSACPGEIRTCACGTPRRDHQTGSRLGGRCGKASRTGNFNPTR
jgi:hypothetical protein